MKSIVLEIDLLGADELRVGPSLFGGNIRAGRNMYAVLRAVAAFIPSGRGASDARDWRQREPLLAPDPASLRVAWVEFSRRLNCEEEPHQHKPDRTARLKALICQEQARRLHRPDLPTTSAYQIGSSRRHSSSKTRRGACEHLLSAGVKPG